MGRPRGFGLDAAIDLAAALSRQKGPGRKVVAGYEGTSLSDLTSTIGVTSPSLYLAFDGTKGAFFVGS